MFDILSHYSAAGFGESGEHARLQRHVPGNNILHLEVNTSISILSSLCSACRLMPDSPKSIAFVMHLGEGVLFRLLLILEVNTLQLF
jgi:hypothetical protein